MTTLAKNTPRNYELGDLNNLPVIAADVIYEGSAVGDNGSGYARPLEAGDPFRGFALREANNATGQAGDVDVQVRRTGDVELAISGLAITDVGKKVYASDDNTFTLTQGSNTCIGYVKRFVSTGKGVVHFNENSGILAELTDSSGGTADGTVSAVGATNSGDVSATINNNFAEVTAKINALARHLGQ